MNKSKKDEEGKVWNQKYVIWDIIMFRGRHLLGTTFLERYYILIDLYKAKQNTVKGGVLQPITENCYRVAIFFDDLLNLYKRITKIDMYEGLVLKKVNGKLEDGYSENNNIKTQIKCRKATKNYIF